MQYTELGTTGLKVSRLCLGTVFRSEADEATCLAAFEQAVELGCNYVDCANVYREGFSERVIGKAIRGRREQFVVSTKVGGEDPGPGGLRRDNILRSCEQSLERLGTDHVDFLLCHFPDPQTPIDETLEAFDQLVRQGKVRYAGCSNFETELLRQSLSAGQRNGHGSFVCNQLGYSLLDRRIESELMPFCQERNIGITIYAATAIGLLSGRYRLGQAPPEKTSWHRGPYNYRAAMTPWVDKVIETVIDVARQHERTPTQVAMAWCLSRPAVNSVIIGCDTPERVKENLAAADWHLPAEEVQRLDVVSKGHCLIIRKDCPEGYAGPDVA